MAMESDMRAAAVTAKDLRFVEVDPSQTSAFKAWHKRYIRSFPIVDEQSTITKFNTIAGYIANKRYQDRHGPYREYWVDIFHKSQRIGGLNFGVTTSKEHYAAGCLASVQIWYVFGTPNARRRLNYTAIKSYIEDVVAGAFPERTPPDHAMEVPFFFEANNPRRMSLPDIEIDVDLAGVNPWRRYWAWRYYKARPLDFRYIQPAMSPTQDSIDYLDLFAFTVQENAISAAMLRRHLYSVFCFSVLDMNANSNEDFKAMDAYLGAVESVAFISPDDDEQQHIKREAGNWWITRKRYSLGVKEFVIRHELDGALNKFGARLWKLIVDRHGTAAQWLRGAREVKSIIYRDRYVRSPLTAGLLFSVLSAIPIRRPGDGADKITLTIETTHLEDNAKRTTRSGPTHVQHDWPTSDAQRAVLKAMALARGYEPDISVSQANQKYHARILSIVARTGETLDLLFEAGFGYWECPFRFDFANTVANQANLLLSLNIDVAQRQGGDGTYIIPFI